jgi:hypothetical protein
MADRPVEITFAEMRDSGVRAILVYCSDYRCSNLMVLLADHWPIEELYQDSFGLAGGGCLLTGAHGVLRKLARIGYLIRELTNERWVTRAGCVLGRTTGERVATTPDSTHR